MIGYYWKTYLLPLCLGCLPLILNFVITRRKEAQVRESDLLYASIRIAVELENVSIWYGQLIQEVENSEYLPKERGHRFWAKNACLNFPDDINWKVFEPEMLNEIISLENYIVQFRYEVGDKLMHESNIHLEILETRKSIIQLGVRILELAKRIRKNVGLSAKENDKIYVTFWKREVIEFSDTFPEEYEEVA